MTDSEVIQHMRADLAEIREKVNRIDHSLRGNGGHGINTRLALLETFRDGVSRLVWIVIGCAIAAVCSAGVALAQVVGN